ncbi:MAG TPA: homoserine O-acetyltransferase, partial [Rheinheimera sp.]|nr:homoserine O-acetyltransferase [Rheinheimera sp.]
MRILISLLLLGSLSFATAAADMLVQKQRFTLDKFTTANGQAIAPVNIGWEAYGKLNADKSNVILITHYFSGTSHAAGKYSASDTVPGYWDAIIGPGKAIDTDKFYVLSSDTLVNANVFAPNVITTGPATINPATGKPYALSFPVVTIGDFVEVQKALLNSLDIDKLYAVIGPSMGSFQAIEWAVRYPDKVQRLIPVIGSAYIDAFAAVKLERWAYPIKTDPAWQNGAYYDAGQPLQGLTTALAYITQ